MKTLTRESRVRATVESGSTRALLLDDGAILLPGQDDEVYVSPYLHGTYPENAVMRVITAKRHGPLCGVMDKEGTLLITGGRDRTVREWDLSTGAHKILYRHSEGWIRTIALSPDGTLLASGGENNTIILWDRQRQCEHTCLEGHTDWVRSVAFSPDGRLLVSGGDDRRLIVWRLEDCSILRAGGMHPDRVKDVRFSPDGCYVLSRTPNTTVIWDMYGVIVCTFPD